MWSDHYKLMINRNIGLINEQQQEKLRTACVSVCGLGGMGGIIAEILARTGIGTLKILDNGTFEPTNLNRQIYSFIDTHDQHKTDVTEIFLKKINPEIKIEKYTELNEQNVDDFLKGADAVALSIDATIPVLILSRAAKRLKVPLVEGWDVTYGNVRVFTEETPSLEETYGFPTIGRDISDIAESEAKQLVMQSLMHLQNIEGWSAYYPPSAVERFQKKGEGTTLAPLVWLTSALISVEIFKILLGWGRLALAPQFAVYDPIEHNIPKQRVGIKTKTLPAIVWSDVVKRFRLFRKIT